MLRVCRRCGEEKTIDKFHTTRKKRFLCRKCHNKRYVELRKLDPKRYRSYIRKYARGVTREQYDSMVLAQNGVCVICSGVSNNKELAVDHCHVTNKVRGLLCDSCNRGIGLLKEDILILHRAIEYISRA